VNSSARAPQGPTFAADHGDAPQEALAMRGESVGFGAAPVFSCKAAGLFASLKLNNTSATPQRKIARGSLVAEAESGTNAKMKFMAMSKLSIQSVLRL